MARNNKNVESDEAPGAPEWMVTFSDCMTLLLTFFVLLLSFSSFDDDKAFREMNDSMSANFSALTMNRRREKDSIMMIEQIKPTEELSKGSERPTTEGDTIENIKSDPDSNDYSKQKIFLISSSKMFWGNGTALSTNGKDVLEKLGNFLDKIEDRVVIYEGSGDKYSKTGMDRMWTIINFLEANKGLEKSRFNISATSTLSQNTRLDGMKENDRHLEIILLERNLHN